MAESELADRQPLDLPTLAGKQLGAWEPLAMLLGIVIYTYVALVGYLAVGGQIFFTLSGGVIPVWLETLPFRMWNRRPMLRRSQWTAAIPIVYSPGE